MHKTVFTLATLALTANALPAQERSRERDAFNWAGQVPAGRWIYVRNLNGEIRVEPATGNRVEVTATKSWRRGNPEDVRIEVKKFGPGEQDVVICAIWNEDGECDEQGYRSSGSRRRNNRNNDV